MVIPGVCAGLTEKSTGLGREEMTERWMGTRSNVGEKHCLANNYSKLSSTMCTLNLKILMWLKAYLTQYEPPQLESSPDTLVWCVKSKPKRHRLKVVGRKKREKKKRALIHLYKFERRNWKSNYPDVNYTPSMSSSWPELCPSAAWGRKGQSRFESAHWETRSAVMLKLVK